MKRDRNRKKRRWILTAVLLAVVLTFGTGSFLSRQPELIPDNPITGIHALASEEPVVGEDSRNEDGQAKEETGETKEPEKKDPPPRKKQKNDRRQKETKKQEKKKKQTVEGNEGTPVQEDPAGPEDSQPEPDVPQQPLPEQPEQSQEQKPADDGGETEGPQEEDPDAPDDPEPEDPVPEEDKLPVIKTNLRDGDEISGESKSFWVNATDYQGRRHLDAYALTVTVNGEKISSTGDNGTRVTYKASLKDGENQISITAVDERAGTEKTVVYTLNADIEAEKEYTGTVIFSLEATTLGLGQLIPAKEVEIYEGEQGSELLVRVLSAYGFSCDYTGSVESGFFLTRVRKANITDGAAIPDDLLAKLEEVDYSAMASERHSLGQHDFTNGSGWMFTVNGAYTGGGLSGYYVKDGDRIRVRFTLYYGADIGGATADVGENWGKEW